MCRYFHCLRTFYFVSCPQEKKFSHKNYFEDIFIRFSITILLASEKCISYFLSVETYCKKNRIGLHVFLMWKLVDNLVTIGFHDVTTSL